MVNDFPQSRFVSSLITLNRLDADGFGRFIFYKGMMFGSYEKWWGVKGLRPFSHEGLDICFFETDAGKPYRLGDTAGVPMIYDGRIEHITDDFLGKTVIASHRFNGRNQPSLLSLYGHLRPDKTLRVGDTVAGGQVFATISRPPNRKTGLPPHMHLSLAHPDMLPSPVHLEWGYLNKAARSVFIDPLSLISLEYRVIEYKEECNCFDMFQPWSGSVLPGN